MRRSILFISGFLPSSRVPSGGQVLTHRELQGMAEKDDVTLVAFRNEKEASIDIKDDFDSCRERHIIPLDRARRLWATLRHPHLPAITSARYAGAQRIVAGLLSRGSFDEVHCEFIQAASLLTLVPKNIGTTLVIHDLFHEALTRRAGLSGGLRRLALLAEARRTRRWESRILQRPDKLLTLTERDRDNVDKLTGGRQAEVRYPVMSRNGEKTARIPENIVPGRVVFLGQMSREENEDAVIWFAENIWPQIIRVEPRARFIIAGASPGPRVRACAGENVEVTGFIEDPASLLETAALAVAPMRLGSGIKIKVVQTLEAGIPTVATGIGAEGIRPSPLLHVADSPEAFAATCLRLLQ